MHNSNITFFNVINGLAGISPTVDIFFVFITNYLAYIVVVLVFIYFFLRDLKKKKTTLQLFHHTSIFFYITVSFLSTWIFVEILKRITNHPRPFQLLQEVFVLAPFGSFDSFPSAHTALTTALAVAVYQTQKRFGLLLGLFALTVGFSRMYVGVHFPLDVIVGFLIGITIPLFFIALLKENEVSKSQ